MTECTPSLSSTPNNAHKEEEERLNVHCEGDPTAFILYAK